MKNSNSNAKLEKVVEELKSVSETRPIILTRYKSNPTRIEYKQNLREEKGGGGTSGQGHSSEAETHDQESAARFRERKQDLGNSGGGKSSYNLISNSYKVMHEVQQPASSTGMKRLSPYGNSVVDAYPKKMRAVINKGEYERSKVVPTAQKVDVIAYPQNKMGEKCMYDSIINGTNQYCETWMKPPHVTTRYFERIAEPDYSCNDLSSVGSCSVIGSSTSRSSSNMLAGSCYDEDTLSSDAESLNVGDLDKGCPISPEEDVAEGIHRVELHAYHTTLEAIYASGSLSWEQ
ncbi:hypothetical protein AHAS_Ahas13G0083300 [Arachis hypogaea]|uniref:Uncharacterized protein n=1 Tax=Arachis hypogaea TaxID=3818 RepID=A0A445A867_ARAHY|nr:hypothetical protein Ahy_B03g067957 [Arachis hypogaea]